MVRSGRITSYAVVSGRKRSYSVIIREKYFGHFWPFWLSPGVPGADPEGPLGPTPLGVFWAFLGGSAGSAEGHRGFSVWVCVCVWGGGGGGGVGGAVSGILVWSRPR